MEYENNGTVAGEVVDVQIVPAGQKEKKIVVVRTTDTDAKWENLAPVEGYGEAADRLAGIAIGDMVRLTTEIRGREYNGKYFGNVSIVKALSIDTPVTAAVGDTPTELRDDTAADMAVPADDNAPLPF